MPDVVATRTRELFDARLSKKTLLIEDAHAIAETDHPATLAFGGHLKLDASATGRLPGSVKVLAATRRLRSYRWGGSEGPGERRHQCSRRRDRLYRRPHHVDPVRLPTAHEYDGLMRKGWDRLLGFGDMLGIRASGRSLGILGMGRIGRAVARRARGFGIPIIYHDIARLPADIEEGVEFIADFEEFLSRCDILTRHAPASPATDRIINRRSIALLPAGAVLVNAARGTLVDETTLIEALESGHLFAAGLDVYETEPHVNERLARLPNVFVTPHIGGATVETRAALGLRALDNAAAVLSERPALDPL
jgi:hydroxypyruvate reductase